MMSQKARSIYALGHYGCSNLFNTKAAAAAHFYPAYGHPNLHIMGSIFARPCPRVPRHGFVDSRVIKSRAAWRRLVEEVKRAEPEAEIVCMRVLNGKWSAVLTPAGITIGPKNDGATGGVQAKNIPVPMHKDVFIEWMELPVKYAGVENFPFLEVVVDDNDQLHAVQLRDGPEIALTDSFIPKKVKVRRVIKAGGDFLAWEKKAKKFSHGTVVWQPGGSLSSHYAIHCVLNNVPVVCSKEKPKIGEYLTPTTEDLKLKPEHMPKLAKYVQYWMKKKFPLADCEKAGSMAIATMHAQGGWGGQDHLLSLRAYGIMVTLYLCALACLGESRHYNYSVYESECEENEGFARKRRPPYRGRCRRAMMVGGSRYSYYEHGIGFSLKKLRRMMDLAVKDFSEPCWEEGYGGEAWEECAKASRELAARLIRFIESPTLDRWRKIATLWNLIVHLEHNGGTMFDKFGIGSDDMDTLAQCPTHGLMHSGLWEIATKSIR